MMGVMKSKMEKLGRLLGLVALVTEEICEMIKDDLELFEKTVILYTDLRVTANRLKRFKELSPITREELEKLCDEDPRNSYKHDRRWSYEGERAQT